MNWILLLTLAALCFGLYNFFIKVASGSIHQILGAVILQVVAAVVGVILLIYLKMTGENFSLSNKGIFFSVLAGIAVGLAEILTFAVFSKQIPVSVGTPVIIGGSIVVTALLGFLFLQEHLSLLQTIAVLLIITGVTLLSLDVKT